MWSRQLIKYNYYMSALKYSRDRLESAVNQNISMLGTMRTLNASLTSGALRTYLLNKIRFYGIDTSHFLGQSWNWGKYHKGGFKKKLPKEILILRKDGLRTSTKFLRRALVEIGREYKCSKCGLNSWREKDLRLEIEHINQNPIDNNPENLCFLCPNCHSQTETFCIMPQ